jgi:signal transduction histidine kinase
MDLETNTAREAFESMELLKADVLGTVSHELRGPLTAIKGYTTTLLRHERHLAREERHQFLKAINEASDRLEVIIERLLSVSQLETGQVTLQRSPVDMAYLVGEAVATVEERVAGQLPGRFTFNVRLEDADGTPGQTVPLILADPRRLREVLDNLLDNAVQYSPEGGSVNVVIRPVVHLQPVVKGMSEAKTDSQKTEDTPTGYAPQNMLEICVCDGGQGIPADHLERIFYRFHRVDTRLIRETNGLGLGLAICKRIVALHNGVIWAENRSDGKGSVFHLRLPLSDTPLI